MSIQLVARNQDLRVIVIFEQKGQCNRGLVSNVLGVEIKTWKQRIDANLCQEKELEVARR